MGKDGKDVKKGGKVEIKDVKKGGKGVIEEQKVVEDRKFEFIYENLVGKNRRKHLNGFWFTKFKISIAQIFYAQNRFENCLTLITKLKKDCEEMHDVSTSKMADEIESRVYIRQGKIDLGIQKLKECVEQITVQDINSGRLQGDLGELLYEKQEYQKAFQMFKSCHAFFSQVKNEMRYE